MASPLREICPRDVRFARHLGEGGFGTVDLVYVRGVMYARKQIRPEMRTARSSAQLTTETLLAASLSHPHIVAVHFVVRDGGEVVAALLGYAEMGSLSAVIHRDPEMSMPDKMKVGLWTAQALEHMHSLTPPVCHFDIKPCNILVDASGTPRLSDFGLSREIILACRGKLGTPGFSAPEVAANRGSYEALPTDVYSFGCV